MRKIELLSPAGNFLSLKAAIHAGADSIYIGLKRFGARAFSENFTREEVVEAIKLCHTYGVKLYVAMNTLIKDSEVDEFLSNVRFLHENGIDAILIQDFGMMMLVREMFPNLEIHASTQFNNSSINTLKLLEKIGIKRAVLSRELSLDEIKEMDNIKIEKEVFVHGALCISYSGCCLFSSIENNRSGNRGECSGCCRLPYKLEKNNQIIDEGYLLSTKELNTSSRIKELEEANIDCIKIEGRMKSPAYVYFVTRLYRNLIDKTNIDLDKEEEKLKILFNRDFTLGHLFNKNNHEIMNTDSSNHKGIKIGKVIDINKNKIKIKLFNTIHQEDGIRFKESSKGFIVNYLYDENMKLVSSCDNICYLDNKINLKEKDTLYLTSSKYLEKQISNYELKKIGIDLIFKAHLGKEIEIIVDDHKNIIKLKGIVPEKALKTSTDYDRIKLQLLRTNDTPYKIENIKIECDSNIFIPIKEINNLRRQVLEELTSKRCEVKSIEEKIPVFEKLDIKPTNLKTIVVNDYNTYIKYKNEYDRIYITDKNLYEKYKDNKKVYYSGLSNLLNIEYKERNLIHDISEPNTKYDISDYNFNVFNKYSLYYLHKLGYKTVTLSLELTTDEIKNLQKEFIEKFNFIPNIEVVGKDRILLMTIKGDILKEHSDVLLVDVKNNKYRVEYKDGFTYIYDYKITNNLELCNKKLHNINIRVDTTFV